MKPGPKPFTDEQRQDAFWAKVEKTETCWLWRGALTHNGYGQFVTTNRRKMYAHRFAYGPVTAGMDLDHLCRVRNCVRKSHLQPVTRHENIMRGSGPDIQRAIHAAKTHCKQGHEFTEANTYIGAKGWRSCRECGRLRMQARRAG